MSIKDFVREHCPASLHPILRESYRAVTWPARYAKRTMIARRALKYTPYYQDELSLEILHDRIEYLKSGDINVFLRRFIKEGWRFHLYDLIDSCEMDYSKYSLITVVHDGNSRELEYTRRLLELCLGSKGFRLVPQAEFFEGCEVKPDELIIAVNCLDSVNKIMASRGIRNDAVGCAVSVRKEAQYLDVFGPVDGETIIDAGCYNGATALRFLEWGKGKVSRIYSFEPDSCSYVRCQDRLKDYADRITLINKGLWNKDDTVFANPDGSGGSSVLSKGSTEIKLTSIDNTVNGGKVTLIELDIEGAELKALEGAKNTIICHHPRLAISVYHKPEDIYEIPGYILSLVPEYKFYLRHYSSRNWETVLYASCE